MTNNDGGGRPVLRGRLTDWLVVVLLMAALILSFVDRIAVSLLIDPIKASLGLTDAQFGLLHGIAFGIFFAFMGVPFGWLADRWSRKGAILTGLGIWTLGTAACGLSSSFMQLLMSRISVGAGEAGLAPASYSIVHDRFPRHQLGRAISLFQVGSVVGSGLALAITGLVFGHFQGQAAAGMRLPGGLEPWQMTMLAVAAPGILFLGLIALVREPARRSDPTARGLDDGPGLLRALADRWRIYLPLFAGMSGLILVAYALVSWMPAILGRTLGWTPDEIGSRYGAVVLLASPAGLLTGGWLADRLARARKGNSHLLVAALAALLAVPPGLAFGLPGTGAGILTLAAGLHFAVAMPMGVVPAFLQLDVPARVRAQVSAFYVLVINVVGLGVGPTLIGGLSSMMHDSPAGIRSAFGLVIACALVIATALLAALARATRGNDFQPAGDLSPKLIAEN